MDDLVERHLYAYKLNGVRLNGLTSFEEKCFIETNVREITLFAEHVSSRATVELYLPRKDLVNKFPQEPFSIALPNDKQQKLSVQCSDFGLSFLGGSQYYHMRYEINCKDVEQAKSAVDIVKRKLADRINNLAKAGVLRESMLFNPQFKTMAGSEYEGCSIYAYATIRKDEDKTYIVRHYLLPVSDTEGYSLPIPREFQPALAYLKALPNFDSELVRIQNVGGSANKYAIFEIPKETKAKTADELKTEEGKYMKLLTHDMNTMSRRVAEAMNKIKKEYADTDEINIDISKKTKITMFMRKTLTYEQRDNSWYMDFECFIPHELFEKKFINVKTLSEEIGADVGAGGTVSNREDLTFFRKIAMNRFAVDLPPSQSKEEVEQLYTNTVEKIKTIVETQIKEKIKKLDKER